MPNSKQRLISVDLFAGCGGLTKGLQEAGFECLAFNEISQEAASTFQTNFPETKSFVGDISEVLSDKIVKDELIPLIREVGDLDLLCGGPPCQEYSRSQARTTQKSKTKDIPQSYLFQEMVRLIRLTKPKVFLFENVEGLLSAKWTNWKSSRKGEVFRRVWKEFESLEQYEIQPTLLYAYDFGIPQNRPRVMIMGVRSDVYAKSQYDKVFFNPRQRKYSKIGKKSYSSVLKRNGGLFPTENNLGFPDMIEAIGDLDFYGWDPKHNPRYRKNPTSEYQRKMRSGLGGAWEDQILTDHEFSNHTELVIERFQYMIDHQVPMKQCPEHLRTSKNNQKFTPARWGGGTPTFTCQSIPDDVCHYSEPRTFSVREWARLQSFPDDFVFKGKRTTGGDGRAGKPDEGDYSRETPRYTQIGNAVPPLLAKTIGERIISIINGG